MIAGLFLYASREMAALYEFMKRPEDAERMLGQRAEMLEAVEEAGWDGEWYRRAYDAAGKPVGSKEYAEGKIFIESQGWCVLGRGERGARPGAARARRWKAFTGTSIRPRASSSSSPPTRPITWSSAKSRATRRGQGKRRHLQPQQHVDTPGLVPSRRRRPGPRVLSLHLPERQAGRDRPLPLGALCLRADDRGQGCALLRRGQELLAHGHCRLDPVALTQGILGIKPAYEGLIVDPCIARAWKGYSATRKFRGRSTAST